MVVIGCTGIWKPALTPKPKEEEEVKWLFLTSCPLDAPVSCPSLVFILGHLDVAQGHSRKCDRKGNRGLRKPTWSPTSLTTWSTWKWLRLTGLEGDRTDDHVQPGVQTDFALFNKDLPNKASKRWHF